MDLVDYKRFSVVDLGRVGVVAYRTSPQFKQKIHRLFAEISFGIVKNITTNVILRSKIHALWSVQCWCTTFTGATVPSQAPRWRYCAGSPN
jgi:hypothetical protein